jgi:hypothetical protein
MPHLVAPLHGPISIVACAAQIQAAHDYLAAQGAAALAQAAQPRDLASWGAAVKRVRVDLPAAGRPALIAPGMADHSLIEVITQCATLERLLDALAWAPTPAAALGDAVVARCHPTTSHAKHAGAFDNDLILVVADAVVARFEVSDVASATDGNQKERRDLISLGVLPAGRGVAQPGAPWTGARRFLVVAPEFARRLMRPTRAWLRGSPPHCSYQLYDTGGAACVIEVLPGAPG